MLDLAKYDSLGAALRDALENWPDEVCLIEADRDHERSRLTYRQFGEAAVPVAAPSARNNGSCEMDASPAIFLRNDRRVKDLPITERSPARRESHTSPVRPFCECRERS